MATNGLTTKFPNGTEAPANAMPPVKARKAKGAATKASAKPGVEKIETKAGASVTGALAGAPKIAQAKSSQGKSTRKPTEEQVAKLAHVMWQARGYAGGSPEHDWQLAETYLLELAESWS